MRYYCKNCRAEFKPGDSTIHIDYDLKQCPFCGGLEHDKFTVDIIPDYETPEQYGKRTGEPWPDNAPVYVKAAYRWSGLDEYVPSNSWNLSEFYRVKRFSVKLPVVCAQSPNPPPNGWGPEGGGE